MKPTLSPVLVALCVQAAEVSLTPPVLLPDGQEFNKNSTTAILRATFDPATRSFSLRSSAPLPRVPRLPGHVAQGLSGVALEGERALPGPFGREPLDAVILLPQSQQSR